MRKFKNSLTLLYNGECAIDFVIGNLYYVYSIKKSL